jgi:hypothetical protein
MTITLVGYVKELFLDLRIDGAKFSKEKANLTTESNFGILPTHVHLKFGNGYFLANYKKLDSFLQFRIQEGE